MSVSYSRTAFLSLILPFVLLALTFVEFHKQLTSLIPTAAKNNNDYNNNNNNNNELRLVELNDEWNTSNHTSLDVIRHDTTKNSLVVQLAERTSQLSNENTSTSVLSSNNNDTSSSSLSSSSSAMTRALDCLRHTKPVPHDLPYPEDAYAHFQEIHQRLEPWTQKTGHKPHRAAGYHGPWIENHWITHFQHTLLEHSSHTNNNNNNNTKLSEIFGPYIPIFIPWTDIWVRNRFKYPKALVQALMTEDFLRDDVLYITVNQNADGFVGRCKEFLDLQNNKLLTVFSAGGYGHVPIPLLKQPEPILSKPSPGERKHLLSYVGKPKNAPHKMRQKMMAQGHHYYYGDQWREEMAHSKFQLCPRGFGRTSYHVQESLQMGLIPIQVYLEHDQPWLPYATIMNNISYAVTVEELPNLVDTVLSKLSNVEISHMEQQIEQWRDKYFSVEGALHHIGTFMLQHGEGGKRSDLLCQALPENAGSGNTKMKACS